MLNSCRIYAAPSFSFAKPRVSYPPQFHIKPSSVLNSPKNLYHLYVYIFIICNSSFHFLPSNWGFHAEEWLIHGFIPPPPIRRRRRHLSRTSASIQSRQTLLLQSRFLRQRPTSSSFPESRFSAIRRRRMPGNSKLYPAAGSAGAPAVAAAASHSAYSCYSLSPQPSPPECSTSSSDSNHRNILSRISRSKG